MGLGERCPVFQFRLTRETSRKDIDEECTMRRPKRPAQWMPVTIIRRTKWRLSNPWQENRLPMDNTKDSLQFTMKLPVCQDMRHTTRQAIIALQLNIKRDAPGHPTLRLNFPSINPCHRSLRWRFQRVQTASASLTVTTP